MIKGKSLSRQYRLVAMILLKFGEDIDLRAKVIQETKNSVSYSKLVEPKGILRIKNLGYMKLSKRHLDQGE